MLEQNKNSHLELCINDLLNPTEKSELLLESLTTSQLDHIEKTLIKIKEKKLSKNGSPNNNNDWTLVAAQIAKALADSITNNNNNNNNKSTKTITTNTTITPPPSTAPSTASPPPSTATTATTKPPSPSPSPSPSPTTSTSTTTTTTTNKSTIKATADELKEPKSNTNIVPNHEPRTEIKDGIEWVSFVYSHHRVLRRYSIRTDVDQVDINILDDKFKSENCVYPRANLPREEYKGNRWAYETECNTLGWKLAYLNLDEIAGKRGLIQRAVDSYRNRYPSMRSRRVARQEKLLKGTLRKRKQREDQPDEKPMKSPKLEDDVLPKTVSIDDGSGGKYRVRINIESVSLDAIDPEFRKSNCVYPRAMEINTLSPFCSQRQIEEAKCNELGWKLAWLNPKQLANRKNLLQRVLDIYRSKFLPDLNPRKNSLTTPLPCIPSIGITSIDTNMLTLNNNNQQQQQEPLTVAALNAQQEQLFMLDQPAIIKHKKHIIKTEDTESIYSGTTTTTIESIENSDHVMLSVPTTTDDLFNNIDCRHSISSNSSSSSNSMLEQNNSPFIKSELDDELFKENTTMFDFNQDIKPEQDPLMSQLFHI